MTHLSVSFPPGFDKALQSWLCTDAAELPYIVMFMYVMMYIVGTIPSIEEANRREGIVTLPWQEKSLELGMFQSLGAICVYSFIRIPHCIHY